MEWRALGTWMLVAVAQVAHGADAALEAPARAAAGSTIEVKWTGTAAPNDFVSIDAPGAAERTYGPYGYPARQNPLKLDVPDEPGAYVIRYHLADTYAVTATANLEVTAVTAELKAVGAIAAGADLEVAWTGPNNEGDFIALDAAGAPDRTYGKYVYAARGSPAKIPVAVRRATTCFATTSAALTA
jgi:Ca-activated chloride channel family protein